VLKDMHRALERLRKQGSVSLNYICHSSTGRFSKRNILESIQFFTIELSDSNFSDGENERCNEHQP
jgi:hypothetical protein